MTDRRVFISHSHRDRQSATELESVLQRYGTQTFLDQDQIQAGQELPARISAGVSWCNVFLLIWSKSAASSAWVEREWNLAYQLKRPIIPYVIDKSPLPPGLDRLVFVTVEDRNVGDAKLLTAVLGVDFQPDPATLFPGKWALTIDAFGMGRGNFTVNLRANGQIDGEESMDPASPIAPMLQQLGAGFLLSMRVTIRGSWSYDRIGQAITLVIIASALGQQDTTTVTIQATGQERTTILGTDLQGHTWTLRRLE